MNRIDESSIPGSSTDNPRRAYGFSPLLVRAFLAVVLGVLVAGFWNYHLVDGFGKAIVAGETIGDPADLTGAYGTYGPGFGFLFGAIAGLAATFTACNCVVFAMIPGLISSGRSGTSTSAPLKALLVFVLGVLVVSGLYGFYVGSLGPEEIEAYNERSNRLLQAQLVFTGLGIIMLVWGIVELGFFRRISNRIKATVLAGVDTMNLKTGTLGLMVGLFAVGRPFPVFREFLTYAASSGSPLYGAAAMMAQGFGQIAVMVLLFLGLVWFAGESLLEWSNQNPFQPYLVSGLALLTGGSFFVFYWGLAFVYDIGRWGFKLGWY